MRDLFLFRQLNFIIITCFIFLIVSCKEKSFKVGTRTDIEHEVNDDSLITKLIINPFTFNELKKRAYLIFIVNKEIEIYNDLCEISKKDSSGKTVNLIFKTLTTYHEANNSNLDTLSNNIFSDLFVLFYEYNIQYSQRIVAIGYDGYAFHLKGFKYDDFNNLIAHYFKKLNKKSAYELCKLYILFSNVTTFSNVEVINFDNILKYQKIDKSIKVPIAKLLPDKSYNIKFYTCYSAFQDIVYHDFRISTKGILYHKESYNTKHFTK